MAIDWDKAFETAHMQSWPTAGLVVQNARPPSGRNTYADDKEQIHAAAARHGYRMIGGNKGKAVSFIKP